MAQSHLIKPILDRHYPTIKRGQGVYLYDTDDKEYLDGSSGAVTASIGHGVPEIAQAMLQQAEKVSFVYRSQFTNEAAEELATKLSEMSPGDLNWAFFVNSGSEATETAMKIAIQYWQEQGYERKNKVLSRWMSYHGITLGALSMSGHVARRKRFIPLLEDFPTVSAPYCYRCPYEKQYPSCNLQCAKELETAIHRIGSENVAGFIAEPIIGASGGAVTPPDGYYSEIKSICDKHDILFIADEVMTGIARTGKMFAIEHWGVEPDMITLGKGMSAGYTPIAATLVSDRIMQVIEKGSKSIMAGHTYSANPQSAMVSLAVLDFIQDHGLVKKSEDAGKYLSQKLHKSNVQHQIIGDIRGLGLLMGVEIVRDPTTKEPFPIALGVTTKIIDRAFENGLLLYPASGGIDGVAGDAFIISPPLTITVEEIDRLMELFDKTISEVERDLRAQGWLETVEPEETAEAVTMEVFTDGSKL